MFIKSKADNDIPANAIAVNNFFTHCIKEIDIKRYGNELQILPTDKSRDIYRYSNAVKTFQKTFLFNKKSVTFPTNCDRRSHTDNDVPNRTDSNLSDRTTKFKNVINKKIIEFLLDF